MQELSRRIELWDFSTDALYRHLKEATIGTHLAKVLRCSINVVFLFAQMIFLRHTLGYMQKTQFEPKLREYLFLLSFVPSSAQHWFYWVRKVAISFFFSQSPQPQKMEVCKN